jgi:hypothetical protein
MGRTLAEPFIVHVGTAATLKRGNVDTEQIIPVRFLTRSTGRLRREPVQRLARRHAEAVTGYERRRRLPLPTTRRRTIPPSPKEEAHR